MSRSAVVLLAVILSGLPACKLIDRDRDEEVRARAEQATAEADERRVELQRREQQAKLDALRLQLASAKDDGARRALQRQIDVELAKGKGPASPGCSCAPGDPLCTCR